MNNKPKCKLIGKDGNVFNLLAMVRRTLRKNKMFKEEKEATEKLFNCESYDEALNLFGKYVEII